MSNGELTRDERLQIMLSPEELAAVDDFRFKQRMPSRAAAVRDLLRLGLASVGLKPAETGRSPARSGCEAGRQRRRGGRSNGSLGQTSRRRRSNSVRSWPRQLARRMRASSRAISALNVSGELPTTIAC